MSLTAYYLAWLAAALVAAAIASAAITRQLRQRVLRRARVHDLLDALARYCAWIAAQQGVYIFESGAQGDEPALHEMRAIQREWFPDLADDMAQLLDVHARMIHFLWAQQVLRLRDTEAWLESDHDARYARLWQAHRMAVDALAGKLELGGSAGSRLEAGSIFPA